MLDLTVDQLAAVRRILASRLPGREVRVFGSRARGRAKPYADLDLVIMDEPPVSDLMCAEVANDFEESDLPFRVDLVWWSEASPTWRETILAASEPITDTT